MYYKITLKYISNILIQFVSLILLYIKNLINNIIRNKLILELLICYWPKSSCVFKVGVFSIYYSSLRCTRSNKSYVMPEPAYILASRNTN